MEKVLAVHLFCHLSDFLLMQHRSKHNPIYVTLNSKTNLHLCSSIHLEKIYVSLKILKETYFVRALTFTSLFILILLPVMTPQTVQGFFSFIFSAAHVLQNSWLHESFLLSASFCLHSGQFLLVSEELTSTWSKKQNEFICHFKCNEGICNLNTCWLAQTIT